MDIQEVMDVTRRTLASDLACEARTFDIEGIHICEAKELEGRRKFPFRNPSLTLATFGRGVVISCNVERIEAVRETVSGFDTSNILSAAGTAGLADIVVRDGQKIGGPDLKYLCGDDTLRVPELPKGVEIEVVRETDDILALYGDPRFSYALGREFREDRPTVLVLRAVHDGEVVGMAGVNADNDAMYQIGINVEPVWQGKGVAGALVSNLTRLILDMGKVPYYSTWMNNLASRRTALSAGYKPAWVELYALNGSEFY